ncbi:MULTISPECIES: O-antigen ligase family protein [Arthrobacter]|uniref:O-antigen ligase family protein n=1 Tax=Arthrobacter caoxuetaonis TaxID=2886935 RepID=A0A9X1SC77_9MICC|nr:MULTISPECIES: O-antigen ligase family protein [Arthrobacter]MCC3282360.1 O-antigen ligase family protein [Arthrobacter caoxuetaonis]MCC3297252.1 O-antigen ligase family protein [Arthrobacter caoxuetaonis]MCC9194141.1 O-antigen ligase family protein [Arthrobacter sp. zg-Y916]USQ58191.1 O-antigen ligase family protein [Arthrobacter caoxuetaonis]
MAGIDAQPAYAGAADNRAGTTGDAVSFLTVYLILTVVLPSYLAITALGSLGRPSTLWGLLGLFWWVFERLRRTTAVPHGSKAVRWALLLFLGAVLMSYAVSNLQGIPPSESTPADTGMLRVAGWVGIALLANDGIPSWERWLVLIRRLVFMGGLTAVLGLGQFLTGQSLLEWMSFPGFTADSAYGSVSSRGEFVRPSGTASQPLEYAVVLSMVLPLALTLALTERQRSLAARWWPVLALALASITSGSRSAFIGAAVGLVVLVPTWSAAVRLRVLIAMTVVMGIVYVAVPGIAGTVRGMFQSLGNDSSSLSRTDSYDIAVEIASRNLYFGRGFGTFLPHYRIFDNGYLTALVEIGVIGVLLLILVLLAGMWCSFRTARSTAPAGSPVRAIGAALAASILAGGVLFAFFDGLNFSISAALLFLMAGVAGSYRGLNRTPSNGKSPLQEDP